MDQTTATQAVNLGQYSIPVILVTVLALIYKMAGEKIKDRWKPAIAVALGIGLGIVNIFYNGLGLSWVTVVDNVIYGIMVGCSAVGLYEVQRTVTNPRG